MPTLLLISKRTVQKGRRKKEEGKVRKKHGAFGKSDIKGKAATDSGEHAWTRTSFNEARGRSDPPTDFS
jgi:hypothetical protein